MLYRIDMYIGDKYLCIYPNLDQIQPIDKNIPFIGAPKGQEYGDKWESLYMEFRDNHMGTNGIYPDVSVYYDRLFLSVKAYNCLHQILAPHGEFLPVTYEKGDGYLFNPFTVLEPIEESKIFDENDHTFVLQCDFPEDAPIVFIGVISSYHLFIKDPLYNMIKRCGLKGLDIYHNQYTAFEEPEGGITGDQHCDCYENG